MEDETSKSTNILIGILFLALIVIVFLLALFLVTNAFSQTVSSDVQINNESGWLNETGYTLLGNPIYIKVTDLNGSILTSGNYTIIGNKIYNNTQLQC